MKKFGVNDRAIFLLMAIPFLCVAWGAVVWIQYGIDFPWYDDWRGYQNGNIQSLHLAYLFTPTNDTLSPVGLALDAIFQRVISGNSIVYQLVSMLVVLISILILQLSMLRRIFERDRHVILCFLFTLPMLQPGSYWGGQNLAYHQVLPLLFFMLAIWFVFFSGIRNFARQFLLVVLGLLSGFSYISGAFAFLVGGLFLLIFSYWLMGGNKRNVFVCSVSMLSAGIVASSIQLMYAFGSFGSTHSQISIAYPTQFNFWMYLLGKLGRSLLLPVHHPWLALSTTLLAVIVIFLLVAFVFKNMAFVGRDENNHYQAGFIFLTLFAVLGSYIMIVAAGRANYYSKEGEFFLTAFIAGFDRFHFFWLTILWPWVVAVLIKYSPKISNATNGRGFYIAAIVCLGVMSGSNLWRHGAWHEMALQIRKPVYDCFAKSLNDSKAIRCERLLPYSEENGIKDATPAYLHAVKINASFLRYLPRIDDLSRSSALVPFFVIDGIKDKLAFEDLARNDDGSLVAVGDFPKIIFRELPAKILEKCTRLDVVFESNAETDQYFQLFFQEYGRRGYQEIHSKKTMLLPDENSVRKGEFRLVDVKGFASEMRLDVPKNINKFKIDKIKFYCVFGSVDF